MSHFESPVLLFAKGSVESTRKVPTFVWCELGVELNIGCEFIMTEDSPRARGRSRQPGLTFLVDAASAPASPRYVRTARRHKIREQGRPRRAEAFGQRC